MREWLSLWALEGKKGGMSCKQVNWEDVVAEHHACAEDLSPPGFTSNENWARGKWDVEEFIKYLVKCPKRKAQRPGSLPAELWLMLLQQNWRAEPQSAGLGSLGGNTSFGADGAAAPKFVRGATEEQFREDVETHAGLGSLGGSLCANRGEDDTAPPKFVKGTTEVEADGSEKTKRC